MTDKETQSHVLIECKSNIHCENGERVLELSENGLLDYFKVKRVIIVR